MRHIVCAVLIAVGAVFLAQCDCSEEPCAEWAEIGDTYSVEILSLRPRGADARPPSCPASLDIEPGDVIEMTARGLHGFGYMSGHNCANDCLAIYADLRIGSATFGPDVEESHTEERPFWFGRQSEVDFGDGCTGDYTIALSAENVTSSSDAPEFVLTREFTRARNACVDRFGDTPHRSSCIDRWLVRVSGPDGPVEPSTR